MFDESTVAFGLENLEDICDTGRCHELPGRFDIVFILQGMKGMGTKLVNDDIVCNSTLGLFSSEGGGEGRGPPREDCICKQIREWGCPALNITPRG